MKPLILVAVLLLLAACTRGPADGGPLRLTAEDDGTTIELTVGQTIEVTLEGNPTTGFSWEVETLDSAILRPMGEPTFEAESDLIGAGGAMTLRFEAIAAGQSPLRLIYHRAFEEGVAPERSFEVVVTVR